MHFACMRQTKPAVAHKSVGHVLSSASRGGGSMHFACMCQTEPAVARESVGACVVIRQSGGRFHALRLHASDLNRLTRESAGAGMSSSSSVSLPRCPFGLTLR